MQRQFTSRPSYRLPILFAFLVILISRIVSAQPIDLAIFGGQSGEPNPTTGWLSDTVHRHFCLAYYPFADEHPRLGLDQDRWRQLPDQQLDRINPVVSGVPRRLKRGTQAIFTPPNASGETRFWFVTNGIHTWDSTMRRVNVFPSAPRHAVVPPSTNDIDGIWGHSRALMLPVRDTPGVFRHIVTGYRPGRNLRLPGIWGSSERIYVYTVDARYDASVPTPEAGDAGPSPHLRYRPSLTDTAHAEQAVAWEGDARPYDFDRDELTDGPLPTVSRITAIAHGNGRDWWIIAIGGQSAPSAVAVFLLNSLGELTLHSVDPNGVPYDIASTHFNRTGLGLAVSPSGDRFAIHCISVPRYGPTPWGEASRQGVVLWDFDRCSGEITGRTHIDVDYRYTGLLIDDITGENILRNGGGIAFSASGRYLYYDEYTYLARFDTWASDILASEQLVHQLPNLESDLYGSGDLNFKSGLTRMGITAGDQPLLLSHAGGSARRMYAFDNLDATDPAEVGGGTDAFDVPCMNSNAFLSTRYQIYDLDGASCDTLGIDGPTEGWYDPAYQGIGTSTVSATKSSEVLRVYPNPVGQGSGLLSVELPGTSVAVGTAQLQVVDARGRVLRTRSLAAGQSLYVLDVAGLPAGWYVVSYTSREVTAQARVLVQ